MGRSLMCVRLAPEGRDKLLYPERKSIPFLSSPLPETSNLQSGAPQPPSAQCIMGSPARCSERLRIAFVIDSIGGWCLGGTEKQLANLARTLNPQVFEPVIYVLQPTTAALAKEVGCPVILINATPETSRLRSFLKLFAALKRFQPHIVQTFFIDGTFYGTLAAWLNRVPVIVQSRRNAGHWQTAYHTVALRLINCLVDAWQCNSRFVAGKLQTGEKVASKRVTVLPNSIDLSHFSPATAEQRSAIRAQLGLPAQAPVFIVVSTLRPVKGLPVFIEAAARLRKTLPGAVFLIVGEGPQRTCLEQQIGNAGLKEVVKLLGEQQDTRSWLAMADIAVLPSYSESSSNALLEYMSMGLPAVVSDIPANHELVEGEFFEVGNSESLAERILFLWTQADLRRSMAKLYRESALQFGEDAFSERANSYYANLVHDKHKHPDAPGVRP